jgi:hypothetical protein
MNGINMKTAQGGWYVMRKCLKVILCGALNSKLDSFVNKQGSAQ